MNLTDYPDIAKKIKRQASNTKVVMENYDQLKFMLAKMVWNKIYCFIRVQDPILLEIEAQIEQNKLTQAAANLNAFAQKRDPAFVAATTQADLREQVRFQRRIELWFEGTNWFDMKRWKLTINRDVPNTNHPVVFTMATDDNKFYHMYPFRNLSLTPT